MTSHVNDLRVLVDNLDEYIHVPGGIDRLKKMILHLAVSGQLVPQDPSEGTSEELYQQIKAEKAELINHGKIKKQKSLPEIKPDEIPFSIPESWKWVRLGDLYTTKTGLTYKKESLDDVSEKMIRVMRGGNIFDMTYGYKNDDIRIAERYVDPTLLLRRNQLITPAVTSFEHIGKIARIPEDINDTVVGGFVLILEPYRNDDILSRYTHGYFSTSRHRENCRSITNKSGQAFYNLSREKLLLQVVSLPPLAEQKRIVAKVNSLFTLIDELATKYAVEQAERSKLVASSLVQLAKGDGVADRNLALDHLSEIIRTKSDAKQLRQAILHLAVSGQLVPQEPSEGTGEELFQQIQAEKAELIKQGRIKKQKPLPEITNDEMPFKIPNSWKWTRTSDMGYALGQKVPDKDFYYVDVASIDNNSQKLKQPSMIAAKEAPSRARKLVQKGTVIYSTVRPYLLNTAIIEGNFDKELIASTAFAILNPFNGVSSQWILSNLISDYFTNYTNQKSVGMAYPAINDAQFGMAISPLPPQAEQKRIVAKTTQLLNLVAKLEKHLEK